jgi:hypothetical protein
MVDVDQLADPVVRKFVEAVNAGDRDAFFALLTPDATMSDDGSDIGSVELQTSPGTVCTPPAPAAATPAKKKKCKKKRK